MKQSIASAVVLSHYLRFDNLGHCRLRIINGNNVTDVCSITALIINKNTLATTADALSLFNSEETRAPDLDLVWEGDVEISADQDVVVIFKEVGSSTVYPTDGDVLKAYLGVEYVKP